MIRDNLYEPFQILLKEVLDVCPRPEHKHTFFEFVYIVSGSGDQRINQDRYPYKAGNLFLLTPEDAHCFEIDQPTQFLFIRFNDLYIRSNKLQLTDQERMEFILKNASHQPGCIIRNTADNSIIGPLMEAIVREQENNALYNRELIQQYVNTLILIVARNIAAGLPEKISEQTEEKALDILQYIQQHIYQPEKIKAEYISKHLGISESYLGRYFKKHANETMQQYITNYKLKLIENRLLHSNLRIVEIADEFGFTDKSHFNRIFKKYRGMNPSEFRKGAITERH
ncbi:AraC family transcriptional regulator [Chitinophaga sp. S165]|uniref:AraC family transcriptional regulator n=1 Tax=Chitinophaga sp. S165 TaxID=2135462 RepID=UPI000D70F44F|nr:AraC family transcriptional regulator [Chitinophaga sp. S165]PWV48839.1 AraC family transcriptional regulator [Chitinophaga sp. S165]